MAFLVCVVPPSFLNFPYVQVPSRPRLQYRSVRDLRPRPFHLYEFSQARSADLQSACCSRVRRRVVSAVDSALSEDHAYPFLFLVILRFLLRLGHRAFAFFFATSGGMIGRLAFFFSLNVWERVPCLPPSAPVPHCLFYSRNVINFFNSLRGCSCCVNGRFRFAQAVLDLATR